MGWGQRINFHHLKKKKKCISGLLSLPDDPAPEQREDHEEDQRAPDDEVVDPSPIMRVEGQLQERDQGGGGTCQISQSMCVHADGLDVWTHL